MWKKLQTLFAEFWDWLADLPFASPVMFSTNRFSWEVVRVFPDGTGVRVYGVRQLPPEDLKKLLQNVEQASWDKPLPLPAGYYAEPLTKEQAREHRMRMKAEMDEMMNQHSWFI